MRKGHAMGTTKVVMGIYDKKEQAEEAVEIFRKEGFQSSDVSVLMPQQGETMTFAHEKGTKAPEGAVMGSTTGAVIGGTLGWLTGAGAIVAFPLFGPLVVAGPILGAITGAAVGGTLGGLAGALAGLGIPEYEAKRYESAIKAGGILLSVHVDDPERQERAKAVLYSTGARDIASTKEEPTKGRKSKRPDDFRYDESQAS